MRKLRVVRERLSVLHRSKCARVLLGAVFLGWVSAPTRGWESLPLEGGEIRSLVFDPANPQRVYAGSTAGHVYRSDDAGATWFAPGRPIAFPGWVVGSLLVDPDRPERLWVGLFGIRGGGLVAHSDDGGVTWAFGSKGLEGAGQVYALARPPGRPQQVLAGTRMGVYRSQDGGSSWQLISGGVAGLENVGSLHVEASQPDRILAGTWRRVFRSEDGGRTWQGVFEGMVLDTEVYALRPVSGGSSEEVWAATCGWVYQSLDFGSRWRRWQVGLAERRVRGLVLPAPGIVLAGTIAGLFRSVNGGASFHPIGPSNLSVLALAMHPSAPQRILAGTEGQGVWRSEDGGGTWQAASAGLRNVRVRALAAEAGELLASVDHAAAASGVYRWMPALGRFLLEEGSPEAEALAFGDGALHALSSGRLYRRDPDGWRRLPPQAGFEEIRELVWGSGRLLALAGKNLFEKLGDRFHLRPLQYRPQQVAVDRQALWLLDGQRLVRVEPGASGVVLSLPDGEVSQLFGVGDGVVLLGDKGAIRWKSTEFRRVHSGSLRGIRVAGSDRWLLFADSKSLWLFDGDRDSVDPILESPFPAREVSSALIRSGELYVGTRGYGLWRISIVEPPVSSWSASAQAASDSSNRR